MLFDPQGYLRMIEQEERNLKMRDLEGPPGAKRAKRANPPAPGEPRSLHQSANYPPESNLEMCPSEGSGGANRAKRANRGAWNSTNSTGDSLAPDPDALLALLRGRGPMSYGAAATALSWGATRAWQAEAALLAAGRVEHDRLGRAALAAGTGE